jgi:hypothetical protein
MGGGVGGGWARGEHRFMKFMKLKKGGGNSDVFYFAEKRKIFFYYL